MDVEKRKDGLLCGSRIERCRQMENLKSARWTLATFLELYRGLLDQADEVRRSAVAALKEIALREEVFLSLSPLNLLALEDYDSNAAPVSKLTVLEAAARFHDATKEAAKEFESDYPPIGRLPGESE